VSASGELCTCGSRGCWKTLATTGWLRARARAAGLGEDASLASLVSRAEPAAGRVVEEYAQNLALGLVNVQQLFAPGLFILHGEAREGGEGFRTVVEERLRTAVAFSGAEEPRVLVSAAAVDDVALLGGAGLVLSHLQGPGGHRLASLVRGARSAARRPLRGSRTGTASSSCRV
jgi:glucokinase